MVPTTVEYPARWAAPPLGHDFDPRSANKIQIFSLPTSVCVAHNLLFSNLSVKLALIQHHTVHLPVFKSLPWTFKDETLQVSNFEPKW